MQGADFHIGDGESSEEAFNNPAFLQGWVMLSFEITREWSPVCDRYAYVAIAEIRAGRALDHPFFRRRIKSSASLDLRS